jgi:molybdenum cofactor cytidylyltransferase
MKIEDPVLVILAAGKSRRMGYSKALLRFNENKNFLQKIINTYVKAGCEKILVVTNEQLNEKLNNSAFGQIFPNIKVVVNNAPEKGRLFSIILGLNAVGVNAPVFIHDVDRPVLQTKTLITLRNQLSENGYAVPVYNNINGHPVLFSESMATVIKKTDPEKNRLDKVIKVYPVTNVLVNDPGIHLNFNTQKDYIDYFNKLPETTQITA